jgi:hypothetical protein
MWSLTLPREKRISGPRNSRSSAKKDFFNNICQQETHAAQHIASIFDLLVGVRLVNVKGTVMPGVHGPCGTNRAAARKTAAQSQSLGSL